MKVVRLGILACIAWGVGACAAWDGYFSSGDVNLLEAGLLGWKQMASPRDAWRFEDGVLYCQGKGRGWLATLDSYDDFELSLEFRMSAGGESGVFLRTPLEGDPAYTGMKIQLLDDYAAKNALLRSSLYTGSLYDVQAPSERVSKPAGQWQSLFLRCRGRTLKVWLNDHKVVDADLDDLADGHRAHPGLKRNEGYIGIRDQGSPVAFRNIRVKTLTR